MTSQRVNLGAQLSNLRELLNLAQSKRFLGAGEAAVDSAYEILDGLLALDAKSPLRFTVESADIVDERLGEKTGSKSRLVGDWWVDVPETMPLSPGNAAQQVRG